MQGTDYQSQTNVNHEGQMPSQLFALPQCHFLLSQTAQGLCRNPGNFAQGKQTYSVANTPSIINSPVLSFPRGNHSTQQAETQPAAWDLLLLLLLCGKDYKLTKTLTHTTDSGSKWTYLTL